MPRTFDRSVKLKLLSQILFLFLSHSIQSQHYQGHPLVTNYPVKELSSQVFNIVQDDRGVMYFAMGKGVVEYDGKYWREILLPSKTGAFSFAKSREGIIYVGGTNDLGYLTLDDQGKTFFEDLTHLLKRKIIIGDVYSVRNTSNFIYFHTPTHIFQYEKSKKEIITFEGKAHGFSLGSFVLDDTYFFSGLKKGLLKIENNKIVKAPHSDFFIDQDKTTFLFGASQFDAQTQLIIGFNPNIHLYSTSPTPPKSLQLESQDFLKDNFLYTSTPTQDGKYHFLGSLGKGGILIDKQGKILQQYNTKTGISSDEILHVYQDKQQNFWLGLTNEISKTEPSLDLIHWNSTHHYKGDMFYAYLNQGKLYVLTSQEIFFIAPDKKLVQLKGGTTHMQKWDMKMFNAEGSSKLLFAAGGGIYELTADKVNLLYLSETSSGKFFIHQSKKNPNRLISNQGNALLSFRFEKNRWVEEGVWEDMERDNLRKIAETKEGDIWLGTHTEGLIKVVPNFNNIQQPLAVTYYGLEYGLPSLNRCVPIIYKDNILVGTEKGLYIYLPQKERFEPYCEFGKQFCDGSIGVHHFVEANTGTIYMAPYKGQVTCVKLGNNGKPNAISHPFKRIPEMRIDKIEVDSLGVVWVVGEEGIFRYDARQDTKDYTQSFKCLVRKVAIHKDSVIYWGNDHKKVENQSLMNKFPYRYRDIKFEFAAPFFDQEEKTLYSYCLEGNDKSWSPWSYQTEKEYTNLWEGAYTFQAKAKNIYGIVSTVAEYTFVVHPPWYRTWWAYSLYIILSLMMIAWSNKMYHYRLVKKKLSLERRIRERTLVIKQQNMELKKQKEIADLQANDLKQLNQTKDKIFAILGHDLRSPINSLTAIMELVSQKSISQQVLQMYTEKLKVSVKQVHYTLNNLLIWAKVQMQGLSSIPNSIDVNEIIESNINLMQEIAFEKRISIINLVPNSIIAWADIDQIDMVLRNLLHNAIKFTPVDGTIYIGASLRNKFWEIHIQDNGVGVNKEYLPLIFNTNLDFTTKGTNGEKGTGLGLRICQQMIQMNGGRIWIESELSKGTTIFFTLKTQN